MVGPGAMHKTVPRDFACSRQEPASVHSTNHSQRSQFIVWLTSLPPGGPSVDGTSASSNCDADSMCPPECAARWRTGKSPFKSNRVAFFKSVVIWYQWLMALSVEGSHLLVNSAVHTGDLFYLVVSPARTKA